MRPKASIYFKGLGMDKRNQRRGLLNRFHSRYQYRVSLRVRRLGPISFRDIEAPLMDSYGLGLNSSLCRSNALASGSAMGGGLRIASAKQA